MHLETPDVVTLAMIPDGTPGIVATLKVMARMVKDGKKLIAIRNRAAYLTQSCGQKDYACEVQKLHQFVRDNIRYLQDIHGVETVQEPIKTLEIGAGDCDDKATLLASMLESIGHPSRFVAIGFQPNIFSHVYVETKIGANWFPLETTEPVEAGWEPEPKLIQARMHYYPR